MAKKKSTKPASEPPQSERAEQSPQVRKAAESVARVEAELKRAQATYEKVCREAIDRLAAVRGKSIGDLIDGTLDTVKKHPGPGVLVAVAIGFLFGRLFRR